MAHSQTALADIRLAVQIQIEAAAEELSQAKRRSDVADELVYLLREEVQRWELALAACPHLAEAEQSDPQRLPRCGSRPSQNGGHFRYGRRQGSRKKPFRPETK